MQSNNNIFVCDFCGKELNKDMLCMFPEDLNQCYTIKQGTREFIIGYQEFCNLECFVNFIKNK